MKKLVVFNLMTLDGFIAGKGGDISWHNADEEFNEYAKQMSNSGNTLIFGRVTYEMMASYWPSAEALKNDPIVAKGMNNASKIVFSRTLDKADWNNTRLIKNNLPEEILRLKQHSANDMAVLGSASIVSQLAQHGLVDEYQILVNPIVLGSGKTMFEGVKDKFVLKLTKTRTFGNGNVLLSYEPVK